MANKREPRSTRNLHVSYKETGNRSKTTTKTLTQKASTGTLANTSHSNRETVKSSLKSVSSSLKNRLSNQANPPAVAVKRALNQVNTSVAGKRLSTTSQEPRSNQTNTPAIAVNRALYQVNPPAVASKRLSTTSQESRFSAIETAHNQLKAENDALHQVVAQLKSDLESIQFVLVEFCDTESKLREYQEIIEIFLTKTQS